MHKRKLGIALVVVSGCGGSTPQKPPTGPPPAPAADVARSAPAPVVHLTLDECEQTVETTGDLSAGGFGGLGSGDGSAAGGFGFGRSGLGPGGGGTGGWGTRGTGQHGSGDGAGTGKKSGIPTVSVGQVVVAQVEADKALISRYISRRRTHFKYCYEKALKENPALSGTVTAKFTIGTEGTVTESTAIGVDPDIARCIAKGIAQIEFPKPRGGAAMKVTYPFILTQAAGADEQPAPDASPPTEPAPPATLHVANPFAPRVADLERCVTARSDASDVTVELVIGDGGEVTDATVTGLDGEPASCVAGIARALVLQPPARTLRCTLHHAR